MKPGESEGPAKDSMRAVGRWGPLDSLSQDLRYAQRMMSRSPGFTAVAVLSLALGIGANTAIFSLINTLILRPLPVREPDRLVELLSRFPGEPRTAGFSWKVFEHFRDENHVFSDLIGVSAARFDARSEGSDSEVLNGEYVVGRFFPALGIEPAIGRLIGPDDDDRPGAPGAAVAVLSWGLWNRRFNLDAAVVGKQIM